MLFRRIECASCLDFLIQNTDFGYRFSVFVCFIVSNFWGLFFLLGLGLFMMFGVGLKVLQWEGLIRFLCQFRGKSDELVNGFSLKYNFGMVCDFFLKCGLFGLLNNSNSNICNLVEKKEVMAKDALNDYDEDKVFDKTNLDEDGELDEEDKVFDKVELMKLIKMERRRANALQVELEKERMAAAEAAEAAMAMILRLQNEESLVEMEARQFRRMIEQKQLHDQEVIQSLQWMVMEHESQRRLLEEELRLCRQKLKLHDDEVVPLEGVDVNMNCFSPTMEGGLEDVLISSLDMDS